MKLSENLKLKENQKFTGLKSSNYKSRVVCVTPRRTSKFPFNFPSKTASRSQKNIKIASNHKQGENILQPDEDTKSSAILSSSLSLPSLFFISIMNASFQIFIFCISIMFRPQTDSIFMRRTFP